MERSTKFDICIKMPTRLAELLQQSLKVKSKRAASGRRWMPPIIVDWFREEVEPISRIEDRGHAATAQWPI